MQYLLVRSLLGCIMMFFLAATLVLSSAATAEPPQIDPNTLYGSDRVSKIEITMAPEIWNQLRLQKREFVDSMLDPNTSPFDYFRANIRINGVDIQEVAIRKKGFLGSVDDNFPSLRIKLDEYVDQKPMGDVKRLTLNNNKQDAPLVSQYMAYRFFNQVGVPAPRVGFANLFVNEKHLGVYSIVESVDKPFLNARFGSSSGDLLEGTLSDFSKKSLPRMELKSGPNKSSHLWRVNELATLLESEEVDMEKLEGIIDRDSFYRFWVAESMLAFWDGYNANQNNYFVYDNPKTGRLHFMPWGADSLWSTMSPPFGGFNKPAESVFANSLLSHRLFKTEAGRERYRQTLVEFLEKHWNESELTGQIDQLSELLQPHLHDRQKGASRAQKEMKRFIEFRRKRIQRELDKWPAAIPEKPRKPTYTEVIGTASGQFSTFWQRAPKDKESTGTILLQLEETPIEFKEIRVEAKRFSMGMMGFGASPESLPAMLEFNGKGANGENYVLSLTIDNADFVASDPTLNRSIPVRGSLNKVESGGRFSPMGGPNMRWLQGTCELTEASTKPGEPVIGKWEVNILRLVGGFFGG